MKFSTFALASALAVAPGAMAWSLIRRPVGLMRPTLVMSPFDSAFDSLVQQQQELMQSAWTSSSPRYEITNTENEWQIAVDVPGMKPEDINVSIEDGKYLSIEGASERKGENYEFSSKFSQSFSIDPSIDIEHFKANMNDGVLVISAPKDLKRLEQENVRAIPITEQPHHHVEKIELETKEEPKLEKETEEEVATA
jgi:HSP20 family protein